MLKIVCIIIWMFLIHPELKDVKALEKETIDGCNHNGTHFAEGSLVPTVEPCLSCKCREKTLICGLRVCPEMPIPPPRGCVLVHKKNGCCPYLSCSKFHASYDGPNRRIVAYLDQFDRETIEKAVSENVLQRRSDDGGDFDFSGEVCVSNGTVYKSGSAMSSSSLCSYCYCIGGVQKCIKPRCMLAMEGCKPIFVDATCCPVRYDCVTKSSGLFKSQNHIRRSGNKHYLRTVTRLQRSRGCLIDSNFFSEGQKMPSDPEKTCDVCFCLGGKRQCAPKKCAPSLRNCVPVVPKGQCCPSSYECGNSKEMGRAHQSQARQFDLFSLFFGPEEGENGTTTTAASAVNNNEVAVKPTTEKSLFDAIREGLEFIDSNHNSVENLLENTVVSNETEIEEEPEPTLPSGGENFSIFDLFIGNSSEKTEIEKLNESNTLKIVSSPNSTYNANSTNEDDYDDDISLLDLFWGKDNSSTHQDNEQTLNEEGTTQQSTTQTASDRIDEDYDEYYGSGSTEVVIDELSTTENYNGNGKTTEISTVDFNATTESTSESYMENLTEISTESKEIIELTTARSLDETPVTNLITTEELHITSSNNIEGTTEASQLTLASDSLILADKNVSSSDIVNKIIETKIELDAGNVTKPNHNELLGNKTENIVIIGEPDKVPSGDFFSALISGLSSIFNDENNSTLEPSQNISNYNERIDNFTLIVPSVTEVVVEKLNITKIETKFDETSEASSVPVPIINKTSTESNVENITRQNMNVNILTTMPSQKPIIIKTNPSILESDYNFDYNEPTLPPSLPNLKIIPFLPADAVKSDRKQVMYDYYKVNPTAYPSITEKHNSWGLMPAAKSSNSKIDEYIYDHTGYPSITENYDNPTAYPEKYVQFEKINKKKYNYNIYDYDEFDAPHDKYENDNSKHDKYIEEIKYIQNKYDSALKNYDPSKVSFLTPDFEKIATIFSEKKINYPVGSFSTDGPGTAYEYEHNINRFSPPTKTEGGFLPKEVIKEHYYYDNFHTTKFLIDITTTSPKIKANTTNIPSITSLDPFKDVIKTETPPDLHLLIEDKAKLIANGIASQLYDSPNERINAPYDKDIISITTDSSYNYTSEYNSANNNVLKNTDYNLTENSSHYSQNEPGIINLTRHTQPEFVPLTERTIYSSTLNYPDYIDPSLLGEGSNEDYNANEDLESVLKLLFHRENPKSNLTIPPFVTLPPKDKNNSNTFHEITETLVTTTELQPTTPISNPEKSSSIPVQDEDLSILKHSLLSTFELPDSAKYKTPSQKEEQLPRPESVNAFFSEPFNKLPFLDTSFPVKPHPIDKFNEKYHYNPFNADLDMRLPIKEGYDKNQNIELDNYQVVPTDSILSNTDSYVINPVEIVKLKQHQAEGTAEVFTKPESTNSIRDPAGILKLAGCNIYGRMYRVGRIISELSGPCLECKCTEVGVNCTPLNC